MVRVSQWVDTQRPYDATARCAHTAAHLHTFPPAFVISRSLESILEQVGPAIRRGDRKEAAAALDLAGTLAAVAGSSEWAATVYASLGGELWAAALPGGCAPGLVPHVSSGGWEARARGGGWLGHRQAAGRLAHL